MLGVGVGSHYFKTHDYGFVFLLAYVLVDMIYSEQYYLHAHSSSSRCCTSFASIAFIEVSPAFYFC